MAFILFLGLTLTSGDAVYQKYRANSPRECREIAIVVTAEYYRAGLLDNAEMLCFAGWEA